MAAADGQTSHDVCSQQQRCLWDLHRSVQVATADRPTDWLPAESVCIIVIHHHCWRSHYPAAQNCTALNEKTTSNV